MDELRARLKRDAALIQVDTSPALQARLDASLHALHAFGPISDQHAAFRNAAQDSGWLVSGVTGLAAVALVILLVNWNPPGEVTRPDEQAGHSANVPRMGDSGSKFPEGWHVSDNFSLHLRPADLTRSLDEELINLQSDLQKARESVERDVKFTF